MVKKKIIPVLIGLSAGILATIGIALAFKSKFKVSIIANPDSGNAPLQVNFTAIAEGGATPYTYNWIFADGNTSTSQNPTNVYLTQGDYTVEFTITDSKGKQLSGSVIIRVSATGSINAAVLGKVVS